MTTISAQTILRSRNTAAPDKVLSTLLLRMPRCILAEFNTHRVFSRNAASSRAIPVEKMIQSIMDDPFIPLVWGKNQPGMQARETTDAKVKVRVGSFDTVSCEEVSNEQAWLHMRDRVAQQALFFHEAGYHKQIVNRLLEPWMWTLVLVSSTEWGNFLELRDHDDAEPHIAMLAREIRKCLERTDDIQDLEPGGWHLPFVSWDSSWGRQQFYDDIGPGREYLTSEDARKLSVARCASTSYKTVDGFDMTLGRAIALHDKLVSSKPIHASPAEHVAQADDVTVDPVEGVDGWQHPQEHGNFVGFRQYRHQLSA